MTNEPTHGPLDDPPVYVGDYKMILNLTFVEVQQIEAALSNTIRTMNRPESRASFQRTLEAVRNGTANQTMDEFHSGAIEPDNPEEKRT